MRLTARLLLSVFMIVTSWSGLAAGDLEPPAPPAPTMKTLVDVEPRIDVLTLPPSGNSMHRITQPGSYYLSDNLTIPSGAGDRGIEIASSNVTLDLNGFQLSSAPLALSYGIWSGGLNENVTIRNGSFSDLGIAIHATNTARVHVSDVTVVRTRISFAIGVGLHSLVERCIIATDETNGITAQASLIRGNVIIVPGGFLPVSDPGGTSTVIDNHAP